MRGFLLVLVALLVLAPAAEGKRKRLRGSVKVVHSGKAPQRWKTLSTWATAAPAPAPAPSATPAPVVTPAPTPVPTPASTLPPPNPRSVSVNSTEFAFALSQATVSAGEVRVQFDNSRAEDPHQLAVAGPDQDAWTFPAVGPGDVTQHTIAMRPGRHVLVCPLPGHEQLGMRAVLTVR